MKNTDSSTFAIGIDVGGSHISSCVVDIEKGEVASAFVTTPIDSKASAKAIVDVFVKNIYECKAQFDGEIAGVSFAIPGPFDYENGVSTIEGVSKYENIFGLDFPKTLQPALWQLGIADFKFVNDASAFALGECLCGAGRGAKKAVAITLGTGVGSGFVAENHLVVSGDTVPAYGWVYHLPFENAIVDDAFSTRWICKRYKELTGTEVPGAKEVAELYGRQAEATALFDEYGRRFAEFVVPVLKMFDAGLLILGGNISRAYPCFGKELEAGMARLGYTVPVKTSLLLDKAAMIGAASLFV